MPEHLTRNTEYDGRQLHCRKCDRVTEHRRRPGETAYKCADPKHPCPLLSKRQEKQRQQREHLRQFPSLFGDRP